MLEIANAVCAEQGWANDVELAYKLPSLSTKPGSPPPDSLPGVVNSDEVEGPELHLQVLVPLGRNAIEGDSYSRPILRDESVPSGYGWVYRERRSDVHMRHELEFSRSVVLAQLPVDFQNDPDVGPEDRPIYLKSESRKLWRGRETVDEIDPGQVIDLWFAECGRYIEARGWDSHHIDSLYNFPAKKLRYGTDVTGGQGMELSLKAFSSLIDRLERSGSPRYRADLSIDLEEEGFPPRQVLIPRPPQSLTELAEITTSHTPPELYIYRLGQSAHSWSLPGHEGLVPPLSRPTEGQVYEQSLPFVALDHPDVKARYSDSSGDGRPDWRRRVSLSYLPRE